MPIEDLIISIFVGVDDTLNSGSGMSWDKRKAQAARPMARHGSYQAVGRGQGLGTVLSGSPVRWVGSRPRPRLRFGHELGRRGDRGPHGR